MRVVLTFVLIVASVYAWADEASAKEPPALASRDVLVHGHHLALHIMPGGLPALVLDAGGGADSSY